MKSSDWLLKFDYEQDSPRYDLPKPVAQKEAYKGTPSHALTFGNQISSMNSSPKNHYDLIRLQVEQEYEEELAREMEEWKKSLKSSIYKQFYNQMFEKYEAGFKDAERESQFKACKFIEDEIAKVQNGAEKKIRDHESSLRQLNQMKIDSLRSQISQEAVQFLKQEQDSKFKELMHAQIKAEAEVQLRRDLTEKIEKELRARYEDELRDEISKEIEKDYREKSTQMKKACKNKLIETREHYEREYQQEIQKQAEERIKFRLKELKADYKVRLNREIDKVRSELVKEYQVRFKKEKNTMEFEVEDLTTQKQALVAQLKKVKYEKELELERILQYEEELQQKLENYSNSSFISKPPKKENINPESDIIRIKNNTPLSQQSTLFTTEQVYPMNYEATLNLSPLASCNIPVPNPRPEELFQENESLQLQIPEISKKTTPTRRLLQKSSTEDLMNTLITKNLADAQRQAEKLLEETARPPHVYYRRATDSEPESVPNYYQSNLRRSKESVTSRNTR